jgi:DNA-binding response OmpR family regulator
MLKAGGLSMRLLLVEDDSFLANGLSLVLKDSGFLVDHAEDGIQADIALSSTSYDLVVLDLNLPYMSGMEVLRKLRNRNSDVPVLILSARDQVSDRVSGLDAGANDYLTKPFDMSELEARIRALVRKTWQNHKIVNIGRLEFDTVNRTTHVDGKLIKLTRRETAVLEVLLKRRKILVNKDQLIDQLSNWDKELTPNALDIAVHRLRKKLKTSGFKISTMRNLGYVID